MPPWPLGGVSRYQQHVDPGMAQAVEQFGGQGVIGDQGVDAMSVDDPVQAQAPEFAGVGDHYDPFGHLAHAAVEAGLILVVGADAPFQIDAIYPEKQQVEVIVLQGLLGLGAIKRERFAAQMPPRHQ